jgi:hypothetical protein
MAFLTIVPPTTEPVTVDDLISYSHIDPNEDRVSLQRLVTGAREWCEAFCERAFVFQTKRLTMDFFPGYIDQKLAGRKVASPFVAGSNAVLVGIRYAIMLPWPSARKVTNFTYIDPTGGTQTLVDGVTYISDLDSQPARLTPDAQSGQMWPVARVQISAITIDYLAGWAGLIPFSMANGSAVVTSTFPFMKRDIGTPIIIPKGADGTSDLLTTILSVDSNGQATLAKPAGADIPSGFTNFGTIPSSVQNAILELAATRYEKRINIEKIMDGIKDALMPYKDARL